MQINILPRNLDQVVGQWVYEKAYNFVMKASKVYGRSDEVKTSIWATGYTQETKLAYEAVKRSSWMYYCIKTIGESAAGLPFGTYKRGPSTRGGDYVLDEEDPITKLFYNPNPIQTKDEFIDAIFYSLELSGKLFIEVVGGKANPQELYVLDPRHMTIKKDQDKFASGYEYDLDGKPVPFTLDDIIFHRYCDPANAYEGLSASTPSGDAINSDILANEYNNEYFGNSAVPEGTLECERRMNDDEVDTLRMQWEKGHKGKKKRHRVAILYGGISFKPIQKSPKDMEFLKQKQMNKQEIFATFGVPENMGEDKEKRKMFWMQTMRPKLRSLARRFTMEFGLDGFKRRVSFDLTDVEALQDDFEVKSRIAFNLAKASIMTLDEVRRILYKLPPLPDGVGATTWVPTNMVPAILQLNGPALQQGQTQGPGKPGKPGGPNAQPKPEGQTPGSNDGKPATEPSKKDVDDYLKYIDSLDKVGERKQILVG